MKEMKEIIKAYDAIQHSGKQSALATVVHVDGSSYRRAGARMLVTEDGQLTGAISGGCLEGDALRKAQLVMFKQKPMLVTYDTSGEDDAKLGVGLGCNGIIHILIEPINSIEKDHPIRFIKEFMEKREPAVVVTLFSMKNKTAVQPGTCLYIDGEGKIKGSVKDKTLMDAIVSDAGRVLNDQSSITKVYQTEDELTGFIELLEPPISLVLAGAGNDAIPMTDMAAVLGWDITVVDGRANYATEGRFPRAGKIIVSKPDGFFEKFTVDERTAVILMTHNYNYDLAMLRNLVTLQIPYIGLLGPRKRTDRMLAELKEAGITVTEEQLNHIYGPVGLDVGAESAEEIALSVAAEIKKAFSNGSGESLREKSEPIHSRDAEIIIH